MELRQLTYFIAISDEKNFTRAAEKLFISQPALTIQMNALEAEVGMRLFVRASRSVTLTPAGEIFYRHATQVMSDVNNALFQVRKIKADLHNTISYSIHPLLSGELFSAVYRIVRERFAGGDILFSSMGNNAADTALSENRCAFGLLVGSSGERRPKALALASAPVMLAGHPEPSVDAGARIYVVPDDVGRLTEDIRNALPERAGFSLLTSAENLCQYLPTDAYAAVLPRPLIPSGLPVRAMERAPYATVFLTGSEEMTRTVGAELKTCLLKAGWEDARP